LSVGLVNTSWAKPAYPYGIGSQAVVCPHCRQSFNPAIPQLASPTNNWLNLDQSSFLYCWTVRLARKGSRNLFGYGLDKIVPIPKRFTKNLKKALEPYAAYYEKNCLDYVTLCKYLKMGKRVTLKDFLVKAVLNGRVWGIFGLFYRGEIFFGLSKVILAGISIYDVSEYAYKAYKYSYNRDKNQKQCLRQALKWTVGSEIGNAGFDFGILLSKTHWSQTGFLADTLVSALFDKSIQKWFNA